jgi:hypothetical protein
MTNCVKIVPTRKRKLCLNQILVAKKKAKLVKSLTVKFCPDWPESASPAVCIQNCLGENERKGYPLSSSSHVVSAAL